MSLRGTLPIIHLMADIWSGEPVRWFHCTNSGPVPEDAVNADLAKLKRRCTCSPLIAEVSTRQKISANVNFRVELEKRRPKNIAMLNATV